jgi:hypothetical protein
MAAGGLVTFVATKVTKKAPSRNASLRTRPLPYKSGKTWAAIFLRGYPIASIPCKQKFAMPCRARATIVLPDFIRSLPAGEKRELQLLPSADKLREKAEKTGKAVRPGRA